MKTTNAAQLLSALSQETRLEVFRLLVRAGAEGLPAGEISGRVGVAPSTLSFHLKELAHCGLISARPSGRFVIYSANYALMNALLGFLTENCCGGRPELCAPRSKTPATAARKRSRA